MRASCRKAKTVHNIGEVDHRTQVLTYSFITILRMDFGNAFATTDIFVNPRKGIPFVQCSTENQLSDFRRADSHE